MAFGNATKGYVRTHSGGGGGGGTSNYNDLSNKPSINGVTLSGNKTSEDLGISGGGGLTLTDITNDITSNFVDISNYKSFIILAKTGNVIASGIFPIIALSNQMVGVINLESANLGVQFLISNNTIKINKYSGDLTIYKIYGVN